MLRSLRNELYFCSSSGGGKDLEETVGDGLVDGEQSAIGG